MSANQLLEKALSTTSEDEAIACLRMARKKGLKLTTAKNTLDDQIIQALHGRVHILNEEKHRLRREMQDCNKKREKISETLVSYQAILMVTVICFSMALLFALMF